MNLLYLCHRIPYPPNKGDKIRSYNEVKYLSRRHEIDLACLADHPDDMKHRKELECFCRKVALAPLYPWKAKLSGISALAQNLPLSVGYFYSGKLQKVVDRWMRNNRYDAIICFSSPMAGYLFRCPFSSIGKSPEVSRHHRARPRLIMDFCDVDSDKWGQYARCASFPLNLIYWIENRRLLAFEKAVADRFDYSIYISENEADLFYRLHPKAVNVKVIPNGVDCEYFSPDKTHDGIAEAERSIRSGGGPILVFTGAMDYHANVDGMLWFCARILPEIRHKYPDVRFLIVGSNPHPDVRALEKHPGVRVTGFVPDVRPYYRAGDVSVIPLRLARGVQNKVLEAMAMGKAVVSTSAAVRGIEKCSEAGPIVADDPDAFAEAVCGLLENPDMRESLQRSALSYARSRYGWTTNMEKLDELLTR